MDFEYIVEKEEKAVNNNVSYSFTDEFIIWAKVDSLFAKVFMQVLDYTVL